MAYVMISMIQRELDEFKDIVWNPHRIRKQKETYMPDGIPNHIYAFPEEYGMKDCGNKLIYIKTFPKDNLSKSLGKSIKKL